MKRRITIDANADILQDNKPTGSTFSYAISKNLVEGQDEPATEGIINFLIQNEKLDTNKISDGYHTFSELYEHRIVLFIRLCSVVSGAIGIMKQLNATPVWKSQYHSDGSIWEGWFLLGLMTKPGEQVTYHLPMSYWNDCSFASTLPKAPEFDGHTSSDVLERLKTVNFYK